MSAQPSAGRAAHTSILIPRETITLTLSQRYDPSAFYHKPRGLHVFESFRNRVVVNAKAIDAGTSYRLVIHDLGRDVTEEEIEAALSQSHFFDETAVCAIAEELIGKQLRGGKGHLQHTGRANLFYLPSCVADVSWYDADREWGAYAWSRFGGRWFVGAMNRGDRNGHKFNRVFSPA